MTDFPDVDALADAAIVAQMAAATEATGSRLLDDVETFLSRFVVYPSEAARVAHVLWIAAHVVHGPVGLDAADCVPLTGAGLG